MEEDKEKDPHWEKAPLSSQSFDWVTPLSYEGNYDRQKLSLVVQAW